VPAELREVVRVVALRPSLGLCRRSCAGWARVVTLPVGLGPARRPLANASRRLTYLDKSRE